MILLHAFEYAATRGATTEVLRYLLDYELKYPERDFRFRGQIYELLDLACQHIYLETARYLLGAP
jgi:hypothetical protein